MSVVNQRKLKLKECWVKSPSGYSWDGMGFVADGYWRFTPGKRKSHCSSADVKADSAGEVLRKAKIAQIKSGEPGVVRYSDMFLHEHKYRRPRRFWAEYETMGLVP